MRLLLLSFTLLLGTSSFSQDLHCGTDEMHQRLFMGFPELHQKIIQNHNELEQFTQNFVSNPLAKSGVQYTIPIVFHIIHNYGSENISDEQIFDQVKIINDDFQKLNADTIDIVPPFDTIAANCQIEFKLAKIDPNGNCTNGITRHQSTETYTGDHAVKDIVHWDPSKYLNIYICADAAGLAGHALLPASADTVPNWDGIVLQHTYCGSIGTSTPFRSTVLTHEIGHYLNLQHTWGGNNVPNFPYLPVAQPGNCSYDDGVADTPNTIGWQSCNLNGSSCGTLDNLQNYMEYAYCAIMFTEGQKARMHACLNSTIANRSNLWSASNLIATGVNDPDELCLAQFETSAQLICIGESIDLTDLSYHLVNSRSWNIPGATLSSSADSIITATFNTPGTYDVELTVSDGVSQQTITKTDWITVLPNGTDVGYQLIEGFETSSGLPSSPWYVYNPDSGATWQLNSGVGYDGTTSAYIENLGEPEQQIDELISYPIDASNYNDIELNFKYAYAKARSTSSDKLSVWVSNNCGDTWTLRKSITAFALSSVPDTVATSFTPADQTEWISETVTNISASFQVDNLMIKFRFESGNGNNIYLDNINLFDPTAVTIEEYSAADIRLFPNPAKEFLNVQLPERMNWESVQIYSSDQKLISTISNNGSTLQIPVTNWSEGVYHIKVVGNSTNLVRSFIITK